MNENARQKCQVPGCDVLIYKGRLCCWEHWSKIPQPLQNQVYATYHKMRSETATVQDVRAYRAVVKEALEAI